ncbi:hypothetical protein MPTK1_2g05080 [Marchantia polymorpha subsp. ruderalis]|uniref:Uncharacterized protein n=1 Tax=Marchantia polymorpha TaxID=3197 RepID=A0A2R6X7X9_MARPO|nr:hypothetical protein MARPO_0031s0162 [Marchantia polymorpha]BBN01149.1 hypothetical protein Mp_2g05080 [Marchantia polymorpha subsp. ruderalis]|eukprot:PTQ42199.1 hypothetical protein MARPO_0031s0162 [Marchantia polymorpha]
MQKKATESSTTQASQYLSSVRFLQPGLHCGNLLGMRWRRYRKFASGSRCLRSMCYVERESKPLSVVDDQHTMCADRSIRIHTRADMRRRSKAQPVQTSFQTVARHRGRENVAAVFCIDKCSPPKGRHALRSD